MFSICIYTLSFIIAMTIFSTVRRLFPKIAVFINSHRRARRKFLFVFFPQERLSVGSDYVKSTMLPPVFHIAEASIKGAALFDTGDVLPARSVYEDEFLGTCVDMAILEYQNFVEEPPQRLICLCAGKSVESAKILQQSVLFQLSSHYEGLFEDEEEY